jgi:hypothetical protein
MAVTRRTTTLVLALVVALAGIGAIGWAATHQQSAPQPSAAARGTLDTGDPRAARQPAHRGPSGLQGLVMPRAVPVALDIPTIDVHARLLRLGVTATGALAVPPPGPDYNRPAWFTGSPTPGEIGPAVIEGHVDSAAQGPSVFFELGALRPGDSVLVGRADRRTAVFRVNAVRRYVKDRFPTAIVYGNTDRAALRLITCGGAFDRASGHYRDNIVVFAHLVAVRR